MNDQRLRWGVLGCGAIADAFVRGVQTGKTGVVKVVASRTLDKATKFASPFSIERAYGSYSDLLQDSEVDAVYVATPHPMHAAWSIRALEAGKHVLCEKPMALNTAEAMAMIETAREHGVLLMEAFMYRCHPQTARLIELLKEKTIGEIKLIRASFGFAASFNPDSRLFKNELGGGAIMDVGCYPVSMARLIAGTVDGRSFRDPVSVQADGVRVETGVDGTAAAVLKFENDIIAELTTSVQVSLDNQVVIIGTEGRIVVPDPWMASRVEPRDGLIEVHARGLVQKIKIPANRTSFSYEADVFATAVSDRRCEAEPPAMTWDDTLENLKVLDRWREAVGVVYVSETPEAQQNKTVAGRSLARRQNHTMRYLRVEGVDKDISQMLMGCDNQPTFAHAAVMFDDWFERGGNAFDTAYLYGGGLQERLLGQWIKTRGVRNDVVILSKGGHTPFCYPEAIARELQESLDRLQTDYVDLYILHRDNPDIPVGEFVDLLHEQREAGRIGVFGGSNWSLDRIREANDYARRNGKHGFSVLSNNLSLAEMVKPVWTGSKHVSDPESRAWLAEHRFPNFAWSSQARGYFLPESLRMRLGADNFQCWDSPENRARRKRAEQLADQLGVSPINIAAAYVLNQPFPSFALIGPRSINETISSLRALDIRLSAEQIEWLWSGSEPSHA